MAASEKPAPLLSRGFYRGLVTVSAIVTGVLYIEDHITDTVEKTLAPLVQKVEALEKEQNEMKPTVFLNAYKITELQAQIKEFVKPDEPRIKTNLR